MNVIGNRGEGLRKSARVFAESGDGLGVLGEGGGEVVGAGAIGFGDEIQIAGGGWMEWGRTAAAWRRADD
jgi:hypothetical protein